MKTKEAKARAYKVIAEYYKGYKRAHGMKYRELEDEYLAKINAGVAVYEEIFGEEFFLTDSDRKEVFGE